VYDVDLKMQRATLVWEKVLPSAIRSLEYQDVVADGIRELLVLTAEALHLFQVRFFNDAGIANLLRF
jgi:hypothetical protein